MNVLMSLGLGLGRHTCTFTATVPPGSARAAAWLEVHGGLSVPIREPWARLAWVPLRGTGTQMALCYELAVERLSGAEQARLAERLGARFGMGYAEARGVLLREGVPVLAEDVVVRSCCGEVIL